MMISRRSFVTAVAATSLSCGLNTQARSVEASSAWPTWRGPARDGTYAGAPWPSSLSSLSKNWSIDLSDSYSGPIVSGGSVFTTETVAKKDERLLALDCQNGNVQWQQQWSGAMSVPFFAKSNGDWIRCTPATDGQRIVVGGMRDVVACFDASSGAEIWRVDFVAQHGSKLPSFGLVCSPLIDGEAVYIQAGGSVRRLAMSDGSTVWESMPDGGGMSGGAFSSPIIATLHGKRQLVVQTRSTLGGVDLETGRVLWQIDIASFRGMNILTPTIWRDQVFTTSYGGRAQLFKLTPGPQKWSVEEVWRAKAEGYMSSPVVLGDNLFLHLKNQRFSCIDLNSGEERWRTTPFGKYWSMVTDGQKILALDQVGELLLIDGNPTEFSLLDRKQISDQACWAHLAMADGQLFIRRQRGLDAFGWS